MKHIALISILTSLVGCSSINKKTTLTPILNNREPALEEHIELDTHVHIQLDAESNLIKSDFEKYLKLGARKSFLISPAYLIDPRFPDWGGGELRNEYNKKTSFLVSSNFERFFGLCGVNYKWKDASDNLKKCLKLSGMIGAKIRFVQNGMEIDHFKEKSIQDNLKKLFMHNGSKIKVLLIHMTNETLEVEEQNPMNNILLNEAYNRDLEDLNILLDIATHYPKMQIILAHSLYNFELVNAISERFKSKVPSNIWIEISDAFRVANDKNQLLQFVESWRKFGINNILYGSDVAIGGDNLDSNTNIISLEESITLQLKEFTESKYLSEKEKMKILKYNGLQLLSILSK